jgi:hypothetical protein
MAYFTCRTTIVVLGSFLDTFQKIADAASNTKGNKQQPRFEAGAGITFLLARDNIGLERPLSNEKR